LLVGSHQKQRRMIKMESLRNAAVWVLDHRIFLHPILKKTDVLI
jgi:hypothetical protein